MFYEDGVNDPKDANIGPCRLCGGEPEVVYGSWSCGWPERIICPRCGISMSPVDLSIHLHFEDEDGKSKSDNVFGPRERFLEMVDRWNGKSLPDDIHQTMTGLSELAESAGV